MEKNNEFLFEHYEALNKETTSLEEIKKIYMLMEELGIVTAGVFLKRQKHDNFNYHFYISNYRKTLHWLPTNSAEKVKKFKFKDASYFIEKLESQKRETFLDVQLKSLLSSKSLIEV